MAPLLTALIATYGDVNAAIDRLLNSRYVERERVVDIWKYMDGEIDQDEFDRRMS